ncbi:MAG TPA: GLUG motif-containing protein [Chitinophagaceae bacterium]
MKYTLSLAISGLLFITAITSCKKGNDGPGTTEFQAITFKFGTDSVSINIDNAVKEVKNMPRGYDVTQLGASAILPNGYSISPDAATTKDYTKGVTYTVTTNQGSTYTVKITAPAYDAVTNPYGIYNAKQLSDIRKGLNDSYVLMNDIQLPDMTASNAATTTGISDYKDHGWYSIGSRYVNGGNVIFRGTLDGQNHVIKNYTTKYRSIGDPLPAGIDAGHDGKSTDGMFGYATKATFKNIGIQLAPAGLIASSSDDGYGDVGGLVGMADSCIITNCFVTGNSNIAADQNVGGLVGKSWYSTISKSYASLTSASGNYVITSQSDGGG